VEQRPDVRQAEENLHSASALVGVARANRLPIFALTADAGTMTVIFSHMFDKGGFWDTAAGEIADGSRPNCDCTKQGRRHADRIEFLGLSILGGGSSGSGSYQSLSPVISDVKQAAPGCSKLLVRAHITPFGKEAIWLHPRPRS
jgi:hypothetical protein